MIKTVLGIESSCDDTGVAIYEAGDQGGSSSGIRGKILAHRLASQNETHGEFGGVVPELASRDHIRKLLPLIKLVLQDASLTPSDIDGIAYVIGPGLVGSLLVGALFGRTLAYVWDKPSVGVHHMEAHLLAPMLEDRRPEYPFLCLLVSGGHTMLVRVEALGQYGLLGETLDDAAGEAFDKTAKLLGLPYPGGPHLAKLAVSGTPGAVTFTRPMINRPGLEFSFSGLKTQVMNRVLKARKANQLTDQMRADIAYGFEEAVVETLVLKCKRALIETGLDQLVLAGGVSANKHLRSKVHQLEKTLQIKTFFPRHEFCTDNGAMVAYAGYQRIRCGDLDLSLSTHIKPGWLLEDLACY